MTLRSGRMWACAIALAMSGSLAAGAQSLVVTAAEGATLAKAYPLAPFSLLSSFDVPFEADQLFHEVVVKPSNGPLQIPPAVRALHDTKASVRGYMLPIDVDPSGVRTFVLTATLDSCHWGMVGLPNTWVWIQMAGDRRVPYVKDRPVVLFGSLDVDPRWLGTRLTGLYQMLADHMQIEGA
jgi:hypothetical protein